MSGFWVDHDAARRLVSMAREQCEATGSVGRAIFALDVLALVMEVSAETGVVADDVLGEAEHVEADADAVPDDVAPLPADAAAPAVSRAAAARPGGLFGPERDELLRALWPHPDTHDINQVLQLLNEKPGALLFSVSQVYGRASYLKLGRRDAAPTPATPQSPKISAEERAEAVAMIQEGKGAKAVADWFGWDLPVAQSLAAEVRRELQ